MRPRKCGGGQEGGKEGGEEEREPSPMQPIGTTRELWVRIQV